MSSVTDWLTSIGTVSAVVISLSYTIVGRQVEKRRRRWNMIRHLRGLSEKLFHELEAVRQDHPPGDISELETYKMFKIYTVVAQFSADAADEDVVIRGVNMLDCLREYGKDQSDFHRKSCLDKLEQIRKMK